uniref:Anti-proliferative protein domain-containing protein n=1 Tax=Timema genevievae TaxID=629358 RepID=A0A7R9JT59_TIMGE|nr:unnamed protein product [Timema genevievae]
MQDEISAAVLFLVRLIEKSERFNPSQLEEFQSCLSRLLLERFQNHWFPDQPCKGQGYRCIRVNGRDPRDATLERAATTCGLKYEDLKLPVELTLWVDPKEVCCRFGEHEGSYCILASFSDRDNRNNDPSDSKDSAKQQSSSRQHHRPQRKSPRQNQNVRGGGDKSWYHVLPLTWLPGAYNPSVNKWQSHKPALKV